MGLGEGGDSIRNEFAVFFDNFMMWFPDLFKPKQESKPAEQKPAPEPHGARPSPESAQHGVAANYLLNESVKTGSPETSRELGSLNQGKKDPLSVISGAMHQLFGGFAEGPSAGELPQARGQAATPQPAAAVAEASAQCVPGGDTNGQTGANSQSDPAKIQQYSQSGVPLTEEAWAMQDSIDGGKLRELYTQIQQDIEQDKLQLPEGQSADSVAIQRYIQMANDTQGASFVLDVMPTEMQWSTEGMPGHDQNDAGIGDFRVGQQVGQTRQIAQSVVSTLVAQQGGDPSNMDPETRANIFGLVVPYNNGAENIAAHDAIPQDGVDNLHNYLQAIDADVNTVATGYSQGGGAVLEYAHQYGGTDGLDKAIALAPMGGADRFGDDGVYSGTMQHGAQDSGVDVLALMNAADPAKDIYDPLKDNDTLQGVRNGVVNAVPDFISAGLHGVGAAGSLLPGPLGGLIGGGANLLAGVWDGVTQNHAVQDTLAQGGSQLLNGLGQPDLAEALPDVVDMMQEDGTQLGDLLTLGPSMLNFMTNGAVNNAVKDGLGWLGSTTTQVGGWIGMGTSLFNPLLGGAIGLGSSLLGSFFSGQANNIDHEDGALHGAPTDGHYDWGTRGYPMQSALPLLDTFLGGPDVVHGNDDPQIAALQQQIANSQGNAYQRLGDWTYTRNENDTDADPNTPINPLVIAPTTN